MQIWIDEYYICQACIEQLETVCSFRQLCIHSESIRKLNVQIKEEKPSNCTEFLEVQYSPENADIPDDCSIDKDTELNTPEVKFNHRNNKIILNCKSIPKLESYDCKHCSAKFGQHEDLAVHNKKVHKLQKPYECIICNKGFGFRTKLRDHELIHLNQRSYKCDQCERSYNTASLLRNHKICVHTDRSEWKYHCPHCSAAFPNKSNLETHVQRKHTNASNEWICYNCDKKFETKIGLCLHVRNYHTTNRPMKKCPECQKTFINQTVMENHLRSKHGIGDVKLKQRNKKFECTKCGKKYTTQGVLNAHSKSCDGIKRHNKPKEESFVKQDKEDQLLNCEKCSSTFKHSSLLLQHVLETHEANNDQEDSPEFISSADLDDKDLISKNEEHLISFSCEFCTEICISDKKFIEHLVNVHKKDMKVLKPFKCTKCSNRYIHYKNLQSHCKQHDETHGYICSFCGKNFKARGELTVHERIHLNKRTYRCEECNKGFNTYENLYTHNLIKHRDPSSWNFHCTICDKRFPLKSNFDYHMRRHTNDRRFTCHMCDKAFITRDGVTRHLLTHTNVKEFKCEHCSNEYKTKKTLDRHLKKAHDIGNVKLTVRVRKHLCSVCPKRFYDATKLKRHIRTHTGQRPFACSMCDKRFIDKSYVKQHLKSVHDVVEDSSYV